MQQIHVNTIFQLYIPVEGGDPNGFTFTQTTTPHFGIILTQNDTQESFYYILHVVVSEEASETLVENCLSFAKRHPHRFQTKPSTSSIDGLILQLKINGGIFDFRKTKQRQIRFVLECSKHDTLINQGSSSNCLLLAKRRFAEDETVPYDDVLIPIFWRSSEVSSSDESAQQESFSPNLNDPESLMVTYHSDNNDNSAINSDEIGLNLPIQNNYEDDKQIMMLHDNGEQYMVLYNGNAEVVGNFRALNFYKASDINIKEDIMLLRDDYDPRGVLMKIDGVEYKFKRGVSKTTNKRFVGYIAQQIESVVPEAVQLIDGILHVDYESLIPYLSESIKQNFKDITDLNSKTTQIHQVVDMMYSDFVKKERRKNNEPAPNNDDDVVLIKSKRSKKCLWYIVPLLVAVFAVIGVLMGLNYIPISPTPAPTPSPTTNTPTRPQSPDTPIPAIVAPTTVLTPVNAAPSPPFNPDNLSDRSALIELYNATDGPSWSVEWDFERSMCQWPGVTCSNSTRRKDVEQLNLSRFGLNGTIPSSLGSMKQLTVLDLSSNLLNGTIPESLSRLRLQHLILSNNQLNGTIPVDIFKIHDLKELQLDHNPFDGWAFPTGLQMTQLQILNLDSTTLQVFLSEVDWPSLVKVSISNNLLLVGRIPSFSSSNLIDLRISNTRLNGFLPSLPPSVQVLHISHLAFYGDLEEKLKTLNNLTDLDMSGNLMASTDFSLPASVLKTIQLLDFAMTGFTDVKNPTMFKVVPENLVWCHSSGMYWCPIPGWMKEKCNLECH